MSQLAHQPAFRPQSPNSFVMGVEAALAMWYIVFKLSRVVLPVGEDQLSNPIFAIVGKVA